MRSAWVPKRKTPRPNLGPQGRSLPLTSWREIHAKARIKLRLFEKVLRAKDPTLVFTSFCKR